MKQEREREIAKCAWHMNCAQVTEQENLLAKREDEIAELKRKFPPRSHSSGSKSDPLSHSDSPLNVHVAPVKRRGRASPVDMFTGEDPEVRFEDCLPSLQRAAHWNGWSTDEQLIQLAGHLHGRAWHAGGGRKSHFC